MRSDMNEIILLIAIIEMHFIIISYFDEFIIARHPLFHCKIKVARIIGFGKSKLFDTMHFYTIISYCEQKQGNVVKISRSKDDEIGKEIMVAVGADGELAVRYEKNNWYGKLFYNLEGVNLGKGFGLKGYMCMYSFFSIIMAFYFIIEPKCAWRLYRIYIVIAIIQYLFLPKLVRIRNFIWEKKTCEY